MTAKTDEGGAGNSAADPIGSADRENAPAGGLPSIIVDPSLATATAASSSDEAAEPAHAANGSAEPSPPQPPASAPPSPAIANGNASDRLSIEDADRFAANIRPSWEPPAPAPASVVPAAPHAAAPDLGGRGEDFARVPRSRKSGILLTLGAVSGFIGLGVLALMSSRHTPPPSWEGVRTQAAEPEQAAARPQPASPEPPAQAVAPTAPPAVEPPPVEATPIAPADPSAVPLAATELGADQAAATTPAMAAPAVAAPAPAIEAASAPASPPQVAPEAPAELPAQPAQPAQPIAQPSQPEPVPVAAPKLVKVRISATPSEAELSLDGQSIPNPFEAEVIISGKHRVQAKANGHRSADVTVPFDQPQELALRLERLEPAAKPRARRTTRSAPTPRKTTPVNRGAGFVSESPY